VGLGFGETIARQQEDYSLNVIDLHKYAFRGKINVICNEYFSHCLDIFDLHEEYAKMKSIFSSPNIIKNFLNNVEYFKQSIIVDDYDVLSKHPTVLFEGAQGLCLDMHYGDFPNVTRSNTGMINVISILEHLNVESLEINYISRAYLTRHGAGLLPYETEHLDGFCIKDDTNVTHEYQGSLRFAPLDFNALNERVHLDVQLHCDDYQPKINLNFSCLDQIEGNVKCVIDNVTTTMSAYTYRNYLETKAEFCSYGPTRDAIKCTASIINLREVA
jgi:adenylosuccinate synthase